MILYLFSVPGVVPMEATPPLTWTYLAHDLPNVVLPLDQLLRNVDMSETQRERASRMTNRLHDICNDVRKRARQDELPPETAKLVEVAEALADAVAALDQPGVRWKGDVVPGHVLNMIDDIRRATSGRPMTDDWKHDEQFGRPVSEMLERLPAPPPPPTYTEEAAVIRLEFQLDFDAACAAVVEHLDATDPKWREGRADGSAYVSGLVRAYMSTPAKTALPKDGFAPRAETWLRDIRQSVAADVEKYAKLVDGDAHPLGDAPFASRADTRPTPKGAARSSGTSLRGPQPERSRSSWTLPRSTPKTATGTTEPGPDDTPGGSMESVFNLESNGSSGNKVVGILGETPSFVLATRIRPPIEAKHSARGIWTTDDDALLSAATLESRVFLRGDPRTVTLEDAKRWCRDLTEPSFEPRLRVGPPSTPR